MTPEEESVLESISKWLYDHPELVTEFQKQLTKIKKELLRKKSELGRRWRSESGKGIHMGLRDDDHLWITTVISISVLIITGVITCHVQKQTQCNNMVEIIIHEKNETNKTNLEQQFKCQCVNLGNPCN